MDAQMLTDLLELIKAAMRNGVTAMTQSMGFWLTLFATLDLVRTVIHGWQGNMMAHLVFYLVRMGAIVHLTQHYEDLWNATINTLARLGTLPSGGLFTVKEVLDPTAWANLGIRSATPLYLKYQQISGWNLWDKMQWGGAWMLCLGAHLFIGVNIFVAVIEALFQGVVGFITLPTLACAWTRWIGQGLFARALNAGFKVFAWVFMGSIAFGITRHLTMQGTSQLTEHTALFAVVVMWVWAWVTFMASRWASTGLSGMAQAGIGSLMKAVAASVAGGGAVGALGAALGGRIVGGGVLSGKAALDHVRGLASAYQNPARGTSRWFEQPLMQRVRASAQAYQAGVQASQATPLSQRLGGIGTAVNHLAAGQQRQGLRHLVDFSRYVGSDSGGHYGVRQ